MKKCEFCSNIFGDTKMLQQHQKKTKYCLKIQEILVKSKELVKTDELICQYCKNIFKTKYLLKFHQTQTKYCLKIQASQNSKEVISCLITCKYCGKNSAVTNFTKHDAICKKKNQFLIEENNKLKSEQEIYKNLAENAQAAAERSQAFMEREHSVIEEMAKKPTHHKTSTKNIQNNLMISNLSPLNLAHQNVESVIDSNYTSNDFYGGQKGAAQMIYKHFVTDENGKSKIICTDMKQGAFHHKNSNGEHVVDYNNSHLIKTVHAPLKKKACEIAAKELVKNPDMMKEINRNSTCISELTSKPGIFNTTMAEMTGKNSARELLVDTILSEPDLIITKEWLIENAKFLTIEHILRGPEGYAHYALSYPLNDRIIEDDDSEKKFVKYRNKDGIVIDYGAKKLTYLLFDSIRARKDVLIEEYQRNNNEKLVLKDIESKIFRTEFTKILFENL
jgi:hypothetical protein